MYSNVTAAWKFVNRIGFEKDTSCGYGDMFDKIRHTKPDVLHKSKSFEFC